VPSERSPGMEWLNGPLVWAIDEWHQAMYLFPRDCPRVLLWPKEESTQEDVDRYLGPSAARIVAYIESSWADTLENTSIYRYQLPTTTFEDLEDAGMFVSRVAVTPMATTRVEGLPERLASENVELRVVESLMPLRDVWNSTLHASGIRLRNAKN